MQRAEGPGGGQGIKKGYRGSKKRSPVLGGQKKELGGQKKDLTGSETR